MFVSARFFITFCDDDFDPRAYHRRRDLSLSLSLFLSPSVLHLSNELSLLARRAVFFFFVFLLLLLSLSLSLSTTTTTTTTTTTFLPLSLFVRSSRVLTSFFSLYLLLVFTDHC